MFAILYLMKVLRGLVGDNNTTTENKLEVNVGIDLGTTFSCVCLQMVNDKSFFYLPFDSEGREIIPSTVYVVDVNEKGALNRVELGYQANGYNEIKPQPNGFFYGFKRVIGLTNKMNREVTENIKMFKKYVTYDVIESKEDGSVKFPLTLHSTNTQMKKDVYVDPQQLSTLLLSHFFTGISKLGYNIVNTIITTPAYFTPEQRNMTQNAAIYAGFPNVSVRKEPEAAALAYLRDPGNEIGVNENETVIVFDFGGGTLDLSVVGFEREDDDEEEGEKVANKDKNTDKKVHNYMAVEKFGGDNFLGGENINDLLVDEFKLKIIDMLIFADQFEGSAGEAKLRAAAGIKGELDKNTRASTITKLFEEVDKSGNDAKYRDLKSYKTKFTTKAQKLAAVEGRFTESANLRLRIFIEKFKVAFCNFLDKNNEPSNGSRVYSDDFFFSENLKVNLQITAKRFNELLAPIYDKIKKLFNDPQYGIFGKNFASAKKKQVSPDTINSILLVGGSTRVPMIREILKQVCPRATIKSLLDVDRCVARGACLFAVDAYEASKGVSDLTYFNSAPLPVGIRIADGTFLAIIRKGDNLPCKRSEKFTTFVDNQTAVRVEISTGERARFEDNTPVGVLDMQLRSQLPKGQPQIVITFTMSNDYRLDVTVTEEGTGAVRNHTFEPAVVKLSQEEIEKMLKDAKVNEEFDKLFRSRAEQLSMYTARLDFYEKQLASANLKGDFKDHAEAIFSGYKEWLEANRNDSALTAEVVKNKLELLDKDLQDLNKLIAEEAAGSSVPTEEPVVAKEEGRDGL